MLNHAATQSERRGMESIRRLPASRLPRHFIRKRALPSRKSAIDTVNRSKPLLQQKLSRVLTADAVVTHHHHRAMKIVLLHESVQGIVGQMKGPRRMSGEVTCTVANIH